MRANHGTSSGQLVENLLAAFAQHDNHVRSERTKPGLAQAVRQRRWPFSPPLGYRRAPDGTGRTNLEPDPERAPLVRRAFELLASGQHTASEVLDTVRGLGLRSVRGKELASQTFHRMIRNRIYAGWIDVPSLGQEPVRGDFEPIVTDAVFHAAQAVLDGRRVQVAPYTRNHPDFPLRRFVLCGGCGTPLTGGKSKGRSGYYAYYRCRKRTCLAVKEPRHALEGAFVRHLESLSPKPEVMRLFREVVLDVWREKQAGARADRARLEREVEDLHRKSDQLTEALVFDKTIDEATYQRQKAKLDQKVALAEMAVHDAQLDQLDVEGLLAFAEHLLCNTARLWLEANLDQKQRLQRVLFPDGITYRDGTFGTASTSRIFDALQALPGGSEREATPTGFESD